MSKYLLNGNHFFSGGWGWRTCVWAVWELSPLPYIFFIVAQDLGSLSGYCLQFFVNEAGCCLSQCFLIMTRYIEKEQNLQSGYGCSFQHCSRQELSLNSKPLTHQLLSSSWSISRHLEIFSIAQTWQSPQITQRAANQL